MVEIKSFPKITLTLPEKKIYSRLGYNIHLTHIQQQQKDIITNLIDTAFSYCAPQGRYLQTSITCNDGEKILTAGGLCFESASLCKLLEGCAELILLAGTVGGEIVAKTQQCLDEEDGSAALIFDAVASESADAIMDWLCRYIAAGLTKSGKQLTDQRFSAGYGDLLLHNQRQIFKALQLEEMGLSLTDSCIMIPEKSVTAISGVF